MLRRTIFRRMDLLMRQLEGRTPLTKDDKLPGSYIEEFGRPPVSSTMVAKYGQYAKYASPENSQISDLAQRDEVKLNVYPNGDPRGLIYNQNNPEDMITTQWTASYDEVFFRKHFLREKPRDEDKDRVIDYTLNAALTGFAFLALRYYIAPLWWVGQPNMTLVNESNVECNIGVLDEKICKTVVWRGKPVYIYHRSEQQVQQMDDVPLSALKHPEKDTDRFKSNRSHSVLIAICTHLGCIPAPMKVCLGGIFVHATAVTTTLVVVSVRALRL